MHRALFPLIAAAVLIGTAAPATEPKQCYRKEDCQCLFGAGTLRDGRWHAEAAPGGFGNAAVGATVMHADFTHVDIIDHCDGHMDLMWADRESGLIEWKMQRISDDGSMTADEMILASPVSKDELAKFYIIDPDLAVLAKDSVLYMGTALYNSPQGTFPATMVMAYSPLPGRGDERGYAAMTMRFDVGNMQFWGTTGRVDLVFSGESDQVYARRREVCRCDEAERGMASDTVARSVQNRIMQSMDNRALRRLGYDKNKNFKVNDPNAKWPPLKNEQFNPTLPWVRPTADNPGNWPCLTRDQMDKTQKKTDQDGFKDRFEEAWNRWDHEDAQIDRRIKGLPPEPYVHVDAETLSADQRKGAVGGWVESLSCREVVLSADGAQLYADEIDFKDRMKRDPCAQNDIRYESIRAHEGFHRDSCKARGKEARDIGIQLSKAAKGDVQIPGLTPEQAETAYSENVNACFDYPAYVGNSKLAALEELRAYDTGRAVLERWINAYCKR